MNIYDIIGPVMVGPSSSHTAGAVRIGNVARGLLGEPIRRAEITLYGSFAKTGKGHGTDKALLAGICGYRLDDIRIGNIFGNCPIVYQFAMAENADYHPNTAVITLLGDTQRVTMRGASVGAGRIEIQEIDGLAVSWNGENHTLILFHTDTCGVIAKATGWLSGRGINIASMKVFRVEKGRRAIAVIETDQPVTTYEELQKLQEVSRVAYYEKPDA